MGGVSYLWMAVVSIAIVRRVFLPISIRASTALMLLPLLFTFRAFVTGGVLAPIDLAYQTEPLVSYLDQFGIRDFHNPTLSDTYAQMIPWRFVVREAFRSGEWPLINPYMLSGDLLSGSAQPAPYDPLNLAGLVVPFLDSINLTAALAFLWAAIGAFLLARGFAMSEVSALFAAAAWMCSSFIVFFIEAALGHAMLLLPLACCAAIDVVRTPTATRLLALAAVLSWVIFAGHPEGLLQVVVIGSLFGAYELWQRRENRGRAMAAAVVAGLLATGVSAIFLLPVLDALPQTAEYASRIREGSEDLRTVSWNFSMRLLPVNFVPFVYGTPWKEMGDAPPLMTPHNAAIGGVFLALAISGALFSRRRERFFLIAVALFGLLAGIGFPPLVRAFSHMPLLSLARNERFIAATILALALLLAMVIEELGKACIGWTILIVTVVVSMGIVALTPLMHGVSLSDPFIRVSSASLVIPMFLAAALLLTLRPAQALPLVSLLALTQRVVDVGSMYPTAPHASFYREPAILRTLSANGLYRFVGESDALLPNIGTHYGIEDVRGFQAMSLARLHETFPIWCIGQRNWFNRVNSLASPFLSFLNVRYALHYPERALPQNWRVIANAGRLNVVENALVLPRAFIPTSVRLDIPYPAVIDEMRRATDFAAASWIEYGSGTEQNGSGTISIDRRGRSGYSLRADLLSDAWIVISQPAWKGWRAFENGEEIPVRIANHAFLAVRLARGHHDLELVFRPRSFVIGRAISFVTLIGIGCFFVWRRFF